MIGGMGCYEKDNGSAASSLPPRTFTRRTPFLFFEKRNNWTRTESYSLRQKYIDKQVTKNPGESKSKIDGT